MTATIEERLSALEASLVSMDVVTVDGSGNRVLLPIQIINPETIIVPTPEPVVSLEERTSASEDAILALMLGG